MFCVIYLISCLFLFHLLFFQGFSLGLPTEIHPFHLFCLTISVSVKLCDKLTYCILEGVYLFIIVPIVNVPISFVESWTDDTSHIFPSIFWHLLPGGWWDWSWGCLESEPSVSWGFLFSVATTLSGGRFWSLVAGVEVLRVKPWAGFLPL